MSHTKEMMAMIEREVKPLLIERDSLRKQLSRARHSVQQWSRSVDYWCKRATAYAAALQQAKYPHMTCEDCWYSCPKSGECCNEDLPKDKCTCGADIHNAAIDAALNGVVELDEWDEREEDGPLDLEDQLENALNRSKLKCPK